MVSILARGGLLLLEACYTHQIRTLEEELYGGFRLETMILESAYISPTSLNMKARHPDIALKSTAFCP